MTLSDVSSNVGDMEIDQLDFSDCRNCFILFHKFATEVDGLVINFNFENLREYFNNNLYHQRKLYSSIDGLQAYGNTNFLLLM